MVTIGTLNGGNITITTEPAIDPAKTRFTLQDGTVEEYDISGTLDKLWLINHGYWKPWDDEEGDGDYFLKNIVEVNIGNTVTNINGAFFDCGSLQNISISDNVNIQSSSFAYCSNLQDVTIIANGGNANNVKQMIIEAIEDEDISNNITWHMPE